MLPHFIFMQMLIVIFANYPWWWRFSPYCVSCRLSVRRRRQAAVTNATDGVANLSSPSLQPQQSPSSADDATKQSAPAAVSSERRRRRRLPDEPQIVNTDHTSSPSSSPSPFDSTTNAAVEWQLSHSRCNKTFVPFKSFLRFIFSVFFFFNENVKIKE